MDEEGEVESESEKERGKIEVQEVREQAKLEAESGKLHKLTGAFSRICGFSRFFFA